MKTDYFTTTLHLHTGVVDWVSKAVGEGSEESGGCSSSQLLQFQTLRHPPLPAPCLPPPSKLDLPKLHFASVWLKGRAAFIVKPRGD